MLFTCKIYYKLKFFIFDIQLIYNECRNLKKGKK
nr:MAG TPA: hypothetical protein [Caudoviricetes sp.]